MNRIFLDEIGLIDRWDTWKDDDGKYAKIREEYGVDPRETFALDDAFYQWLYEHLKMYLQEADPVIDLTNTTFNHWEWEGKTICLREAILLMIGLLDDYFLFQICHEEYCRRHFHECTDLMDVASEVNMRIAYGACEDQAIKKAHQASELFVKVMRALWW